MPARYTVKCFFIERKRGELFGAPSFPFLSENTLNVPGDVFLYCRVLDRHHGNWTIGRQPVRTIIATGIMADVVDVAEEEGHRRELPHARASVTCFCDNSLHELSSRHYNEIIIGNEKTELPV